MKRIEKLSVVVVFLWSAPLGARAADEPIAPELSLSRAAAYLDEAATDWTRERKCGACHTNYAYMLSRPALSPGDSSGQREVRAFFEDRVAHWDDSAKGAKPRFDAEVVATAAALALNDEASTGKLHPLTRKALDRMWTVQKPNGAWEWLKCNWPPLEHDDYYGATFAAVGLAATPAEYRDTPQARRGLENIRRYFRETPAPSLHHDAMRLWAGSKLDGLMTAEQKDQTIKSLLAIQRPDGGWNLASLGDWKRHDGSPNDKAGPGDGYGTGFVVYVLRKAGLPPEHDAIRRGVAWLKTHQRESGRWFTRSLSTDKAHYISNAGTGFAVLALRSCGVPEE